MRQLQRLNRITRELDHYIKNTGKRKRAFGLMRKMNEIDMTSANPDDLDKHFELFMEFLDVSASDSLKNKLKRSGGEKPMRKVSAIVQDYQGDGIDE